MARTQVTGSQIGPLDLTTEVSGVLPVANGGTGQANLTSLPLTSPKVNGVYDVNGALSLALPAAASAANYLEIRNQPAGTSPSFAVGGPDTNISIYFLPAGNGALAVYQNSGGVTFKAQGGDTDVPMNLVTQGAGRVQANGANVPTVSSADDITGKRETLAAGSTTVAPLKFTSGTALTTAAAGAMEYDGATFAGTIDTTSGRGLSPVEQVFRLTADAGAAIGATIADYFGTNSAFPYVAAGVYEIEWNLYYLKTTAGTVTYTITSTTAPVLLSAWYQQTVVGGVGTVGATQQAALVKSTSTGAVLPVTGSLTTAVDHQAVVKALYVAHASSAGNVRLRVTESAGTVTPRAGSYYKVRRIPVGNVGTFVA